MSELPEWNSLRDHERADLVKCAEHFNWPPGSAGQFALEFYNKVREIVQGHVPHIPMKP